MERNYGGFSRESTSEAQALFEEAVAWRARRSADSSTSRWDREITMTVSQLLGRGSLIVVSTAALAVWLTANRPIGAVSVPPEVIAREVRYLDHRTRRLSPLPTEDCEAIEHCDKCGKWHGGECPPTETTPPRASANAPPPLRPMNANTPVGPPRLRGGPAGP